MAAAILVFLAVESALPFGSARLCEESDERWLRRTLADPGFYVTEAAVLALGAVTGLLGAAVRGSFCCSCMAQADTGSPDELLSVVGVACGGSRAARYPDVCRVIASLRHSGYRSCRGWV